MLLQEKNHRRYLTNSNKEVIKVMNKILILRIFIFTLNACVENNKNSNFA
jgi:hypothetical protein